MSMIIDGIDFENLEAEKYWSFPRHIRAISRQTPRI